MQKTLLFLLLQFVLQEAHALQIHQIKISELSRQAINVSLDTEAEELYYFDSWRLQVSNNTITIHAHYMRGFGSTIAYLNNNFQIPIDSGKRMIFKLNVKIYYLNAPVFLNQEALQDQWSGSFSTPLSMPLFLMQPQENNPWNICFQNPNPGYVDIGTQQATLDIFTDNGNFIESKQVQGNINCSHLPDGQYYFRFSNETTSKTIRTIIKK